MAPRERRLGELELVVLKIIWNRQPCSVQEVAQVLGERQGYARTTILTIMQRLHEKGFLKRRKRAGVFRYSATEEQATVMSRLIGQFVDTVLDKSPMPIVAYLTESQDLTADQITQLRELIENLEAQSRGTKS